MRACSWQGCVDDPAEACAAFVARSARRVAAFVAGRVHAVWNSSPRAVPAVYHHADDDD